ncbi:MAG: RagB/SusD family nutrient uptake outer membrane protein, partial [Ferruginibacter sp.]
HFSATDVRNTFYEYDVPGTPDHYATNKFGADSKDHQVNLLNGATVPLKEMDFNESQIMMRVGEMYLIEAEARARQGDADADGILHQLQVNRDPDAVKSGNTGDALIKEILLERRKELYGELGVEFLDAKRLQMPIDRTGSNHESPNNFILPANDPRFNLKIPQKEIDSNDSLSEADQNL